MNILKIKNSRAPEQTVWMHRMIYTLIVHKQQNLVAHVTQTTRLRREVGVALVAGSLYDVVTALAQVLSQTVSSVTGMGWVGVMLLLDPTR